MKKVTITLSLLMAIHAAGCSGAPSDGPESTADQPEGPVAQAAANADVGKTTSSPAALASNDATVLASVKLGAEHELQFVQFKNGINGTIEMGRIDVDTPVVDDKLRTMSAADLYRHFAGAEATLPASLVATEVAHPLSKEAAAVSTPDDLPTNAGKGPTFYTASEQTWFNNNFCNGAQNCVQGFDWAVETTHWKVNGAATGWGWVGSEGKVNASFTQYWYECACLAPFCIGGQQCYWVSMWNGLIVPGHWVSVGTPSANGNYIQWDLNGAGTNVSVSMAAKYGN
jgi:hypothetical protein